MSGAITAIAVASVAGAAANLVNGRKQQKVARAAAEQAQANADRQAKAADEAMNRENQKSVNAAANRDEAALAGRAGASGTMLTGPQGIDPQTLNLGKNTLLGA